MASITTTSPPHPPGPAWDIATLFPDQGQWSEADYLALDTNHPVEFSDGSVEVLEMPKTSHQRIVAFLYGAMLAFVAPRSLGTVLFAPLKMRLRAGKYREPDVLFMLDEHSSRIGEDCWEGADLIMEVVSEANREHDVVRKRTEYAQAGIPEYWIIDPQERRITVLTLQGDVYAVRGDYGAGSAASSSLLPGFSVAVDDVVRAGGQPA